MSKVVGIQKIGEVAVQLLVTFVVLAFHGCIHDRAVHMLDLAIGRRIAWFDRAMFYPVCRTYHVEAHGPWIGCIQVSWPVSKLDTIVCQCCVRLIRHRSTVAFKKLSRRFAIGFLHQLGDHKLDYSFNIHGEKELAPIGPDLGDIYVEESDRVALGRLPSWFASIHAWKTR